MHARRTAVSAVVAVVCEVVAAQADQGGVAVVALVVGACAMTFLLCLLPFWALPVVMRAEHDLALDGPLLTGVTLARGTRTVDLSALTAVDSRSLYGRTGALLHVLRVRSAGGTLVLRWDSFPAAADRRTEHVLRQVRAACLRQLPVVHDRTKALLDVSVAHGGPGWARRVWVSSLSAAWWVLWSVPLYAALIGYLVWPVSRTSD